jgi:hypothetical protein
MRRKFALAVFGITATAALAFTGGAAANAASGHLGCGGFKWPHVFSYVAAPGNAKHTHDQTDGAGYRSFTDTDGGNFTSMVGFYQDDWTATGSYVDAWCAN